MLEVLVDGDGGGLPAAVSPSGVKDFEQCGLKFYLGHVEGWRDPPTEAILIGNVVHAALEDLYRLPPVERTRDRARQLVVSAWADSAQRPANAALLAEPEQAEALRARTVQLVEGVFALEDPAEITVDPANVEQWVEGHLYGAPVRGRIDRMTGEGNGWWRISDYKTGKPAPARRVEDALAGLFAYAAVLAATHPDRRIPDEVELLYLATGERVLRPVLRGYLLGHARALGRTWSRITEAHGTRRWPARTSALCGWCPFAPVCPAKTRDAPPPGSAAHHAALADLGLIRRSARSSSSGG